MVQRQTLNAHSHACLKEEHIAQESWLFWYAIQESFYRQKSCIHWLDIGDSNSSFFFKSAKANLARNLIHYLKDAFDVRIFDPSDMKMMVINFYLTLLGNSNFDVRPYFVEHIKEIHPFRCSFVMISQLVAISIAKEIQLVLFAMPNNKAQGPDGFSAEFFTSSWGLAGPTFIVAVRCFL